ncbi:hypothetical protein Dimus_009929 [Dionaea muscipula]
MANVRQGSSNSNNSQLARRHNASRTSVNEQGRNANRARRFRIDLQEPCVVRLLQLKKNLNHRNCSQTIEWLLNKAEQSRAGNTTVPEAPNWNLEHIIISSSSSSTTSQKDSQSRTSKKPLAQDGSETTSELHKLPPLDFDTFSNIQVEYMANDPRSWTKWIESLPEEENRRID